MKGITRFGGIRCPMGDIREGYQPIPGSGRPETVRAVNDLGLVRYFSRRPAAEYFVPVSTRFSFSPDPARIDRPLVHRWLSEDSYWARGRTAEVQETAMNASRNYGVYDGVTQVAYARVVTDGVTFAWLCDVFVAPEVRGQGVGKLLIENVAAALAGIRPGRTLLATADAHGLYAQFGFRPLTDTAKFMALAGE